MCLTSTKVDAFNHRELRMRQRWKCLVHKPLSGSGEGGATFSCPTRETERGGGGGGGDAPPPPPPAPDPPTPPHPPKPGEGGTGRPARAL